MKILGLLIFKSVRCFIKCFCLLYIVMAAPIVFLCACVYHDNYEDVKDSVKEYVSGVMSI